MRRRRFIALVGAGIGSTIAGCSGGNDGQQTTTTTGAKTQQPTGKLNAEVMESNLEKEASLYSMSYYQTGSIRNTGERRLRLPSVVVRFFDDKETVLSSTTRNVYSLKPGQIWELRVPFLDVKNTPSKGEIEIQKPLEPGFENYSHPKELELADVSVKTGKDPEITGYIKNSIKNVISVFAFGQFLTNENHVVGTGLDSISGLGGGQSWSMRMPSFLTDMVAQSVKKFEIDFTVR